MAFLLRQISHSAEGREIVRESRIDDDLLRIGRDPSSDIKLTDLAVSLHHLVLERISEGQIGVSSTEGQSFDLNGSSVTFGRIDLASGGDIRIASHLLRVMPAPSGARDVEIVLERVTDADASAPKIDESKFSLGSVMPGKRATAWVFSFLVLGLFLAWPIKSYFDQRQARAAETQVAAGSGAGVGAGAAIYHADSSWSSGPLSQSHAFLGDNCTACHAKPFVAVRDSSCTECHTDIHDHADPFRMARSQPDLTSWGRFELAMKETFNLPAGRCVDCHTEHEGAQLMPMTAQRFCSDCHADLDAKLPDTRLPDAGDFGTSHPQFRPAVIANWSGDKPRFQRVTLGPNVKDVSNLKFPHDMHLSTTNGVAQMARRLGAQYGFEGAGLGCADCHDATPDGVRFQPVNMEEDCQMCHSLAFDESGGTVRTLRHGDPAQVIADLRDFYRARVPNPPATLGGMARRRPGDEMALRNMRQFQIGQGPSRAAAAIRSVFSAGGACYDCHQVEAPAPGSMAYQIQPVAFPVRYMRGGWFDHAPHNQYDCASCHKADTSSSATDLLLPDLASCRTCHGGEASAADVPSSCAMCHDYHMDPNMPSMLIRQRVRGKKENSSVPETARPLTTASR